MIETVEQFNVLRPRISSLVREFAAKGWYLCAIMPGATHTESFDLFFQRLTPVSRYGSG